MKQYLLIDIGGTFIKYSLADEQARKISGGKVPTPLTNMDDLLAAIEGFAAPLQGQFVGCAISMPGRIDTRNGIAHTGGMLSAFMWEQPFAAQVEARLGVPVTIANDGKCAAAAEGWTGALAGVENGLVLVLGTGIGGGIRGSGEDITITGGTVNVTGGYGGGAGIGGGYYGNGENIKITDGTVNATGGWGGAGIGGGGSYGTDGAEVEPDICALNPGGKIEYYAPGSVMTGTPSKTITNPTGDHAWDSGRVTKPATCTEKGLRHHTCLRCQATEEEVLEALGHDMTHHAAKAATCTQDGYTGDEVCKTCGETVTKGEVVKATGHHYKDGKCTDCGEKDPNYQPAQPGVKTGDASSVTLWVMLLTVSALLAAAVVALPRRKHTR